MIKRNERVHETGAPNKLGTVLRVRSAMAVVKWDGEPGEPAHWVSTLQAVEPDADRHPEMTHPY